MSPRFAGRQRGGGTGSQHSAERFRPEAAANNLPSRSARRAAPPPADAVFTMLGQRTPARSMPAVREQHCAALPSTRPSRTPCCLSAPACRSNARGRLSSSSGPATAGYRHPVRANARPGRELANRRALVFKPRTDRGLTNNRQKKRPVRLTAKQAPHRPGISRGARFARHGR